MRWAKGRAVKYLDEGDTAGAFASLVSDLGKHPDTEDLTMFAGTAGCLHIGDPDGMRRFIDGFAE